MDRRVLRTDNARRPGGDRRDLIEGYLAYYPALRDKILRTLLMALHSRGLKTLGEIGVEARGRLDEGAAEATPSTPRMPETDPFSEAVDRRDDSPDGVAVVPPLDGAAQGDPDDADIDADIDADADDLDDTSPEDTRELPGLGDDPSFNRGFARRWGSEERHMIDELVVDYAAEHFTAGELDALVILTRKRNEAEHLSNIANSPETPLDTVAAKLKEYCELPGKWVRLPPSEATGVRVAIIRRFISEQLDFIGIAKKHLSLRDLNRFMSQSFGTPGGAGRIGGKAAGMVLAGCILRDSRVDPDHTFDFKTPESVFLRTDLFVDFLKHNGLMEYYDQKYKPIDEIRSEFSAVREVFKNAEFPEATVQALRAHLERLGPHPVIVRSSSLLEDNFKNAFSGKYASIFLGNQGDLDDRVHNLLGAIAEVYASTVGPDPIAYRHRRGLLDYEEMMGIIIQKVVGRTHGRYFFPAWAGVAFSHNEFRWNARIEKEHGLVRIVLGLGSRAVDRVGGDYPRMIALGQPTLRPEASVEHTCRYSQRYADVIDLKRNEFRSVPMGRLFSSGPPPEIDQAVSIARDGELITPLTRRIDADPSELVVTFDKLIQTRDFVPRFRWMLEKLQRAYGQPVDVEFAYDGQDFYVLQCRPLSCRVETTRVEIPNVADEAKIFTADREFGTAEVKDIDYIVYVDPVAYDRVETHEQRHTIGTIIGHLNRILADERFILMGPGRWGSADIRLGVRVTYADISNTTLLVEVARARGDYVPEVSFGTHFFQDLVEAGIHHLPLYPDRPGVVFNEAVLAQSENVLADLLPDYAEYAAIVRVIHVPEVTGGRHLQVAMDGETELALGYLA